MITDLSPIPYSQLPPGDNFLQSAVWAEFKELFSWHGLAFRYTTGSLEQHLLVLLRDIGPLRLAYVPHGPDWRRDPRPEAGKSVNAVGNAALLESWSNRLVELAALVGDTLPRGVMALRFDLPWVLGDGLSMEAARSAFTRSGLRVPTVDVQVPTTVIVDLDAPEEELLACMKSKTRYNVRLAEKRGVEVDTAPATKLQEWYAMYLATARRDQIAIHPFAYYEKLFSLAARESSSLRLRLYLAHHQGDLLAGIIVGFSGAGATYLYGASSDIKRNLMAPYALQWRAMADARTEGCTSYDLFGIPPTDDPDHPMAGLYRFKTGFGGSIVRRPGLVDVPRHKLTYGLYRSFENLRNYYHKRIRKRRT